MKTTSKKTLSVLLAIALVLGLMTAIPTTAVAMTVGELRTHILNFDPGDGSTNNLDVLRITGRPVVIVTGEVTGASNMLELNIDSGVTVLWGASYSGDMNGPLIELTGSGTFEVAEGGSITQSGSGDAVSSYGANATITVRGGSVDRIYSGGTGTTINVSGGAVDSIESSSFGGGINVSGGAVGSIESTKFAISTMFGTATVTVSGGTVASAIHAIFASSEVTISGGAVLAREQAAIYVANTRSIVEVSGGIVASYGRAAIDSGILVGDINVTGGFIFGVGTEIAGSGTNKVIDHDRNSSVSIGGNAVVVAWDKPDGAPTYDEDTSTDLQTNSDASVYWDYDDSQSGIHYKNGANEGFFAVEGVTVIEEEVVAEHTVTFNSNGGSSVASQTVAAGGKATIPADPTKTDSTFGGWYSDSELTNAYDFNANVTANITLYAKWDTAPTTFTVTFNSNGGSAVTSQTVATGGKVTKPTDPTRSGYTFAGWYSNSALTTAYNFDTAVTANINLYAKWEASTSAGTNPAATGSMENFLQSRTYTPGMFSDINEDAWYGYNKEKAVANAYEYGLMSGYPDNTFRPTGNITIAEAITVAARVHRIYTTGADDFVQGTPWFQVYVDYAISNGIIYASDFATFNQLATRREMAYIFANALPKSEFTKQNTVNSLPDVNNATPYSQSIIMLYEAGIIGGSDTAGTFNPGNNITRAEAAAIISRVILPSERFSGRTYG